MMTLEETLRACEEAQEIEGIRCHSMEPISLFY